MLQAVDAMPGMNGKMKMRRAIILMKMERRTSAPTWRAEALESVEGTAQ